LADVYELSAEHDLDACVRAEEVAMGTEEEELHRVELWQGDRRIYSLDMLPRGNA
jgi:hypothetical protein